MIKIMNISGNYRVYKKLIEKTNTIQQFESSKMLTYVKHDQIQELISKLIRFYQSLIKFCKFIKELQSNLLQQFQKRFIDGFKLLPPIIQEIKNACFFNFKSAANSTLTITQSECRIVENYLIIKNQEYSKKRVTNCLDKALESQKVTLPFSNPAFNFNKIKEAEFIYALNVQRHELVPHAKKEDNEHFIIINGCPIVEGHSLFVPYLKQNHPQILTPKLFQICLEVASVLPGMKFGYNSQGSASSVNHFHLHIMPCAFLSQNSFYIENINGSFIKEQNQVKIFHFELNHTLYFKIASERSLIRKKEEVTKVSMEIIKTLIEENVPHNVIITDECTLFIIVRGYANQEYKYGWLEYCGVFVAKTEQQFEAQAQTINHGYEILKIPQKSAINRLLGGL